MNRTENNPEAILDAVVAEVRDDELDPRVVEEAGRRVWARIAAEAAKATPDRPERLESCDDFRALFDEYRAGTLSGAQRMLMEDHTHSCVACRKVLHPITVRMTDTNVVEMPKRSWHPMRWAAAAAIFMTAGVTSFWVWDNIAPPPAGSRITVVSADGPVYRLKDGSMQTVSAGAQFADRERLRTAGGGHAIVKLYDGSTVEVSERAELTVSQGRKDTNIHLERGRIIVQAAKRDRGHLYVISSDSRVAVTGTVFSVNRGIAGSRVSVIEGSVDVHYSGRQKTLKPGDQVATHRSIEQVAITDEISWSSNYDKHLALLGQFIDLKAKLDRVSVASLRFGSRLLDSVPDGTTIYVAAPNMSRALTDVQRIVNEHAAQSPELRQWLGKQFADAQQAITTMTQIGEYLGEEIVIAFQPCKGFCGVFIADVTKPGLKEFMEKQFGPEVTQHVRMEFANNRVFVGHQAQLVEAAMRGGSGFEKSPLGQTVLDAYKRGTGIIVAADLEKMVGSEAGVKPPAIFSNMGVDSVRHLVAEQREVNGRTEYSAVVSFAGARRGIASWLAEPGSMGGLNFVSPDAQFAASFVVKQPAQMLRDVYSLSSSLTRVRTDVQEFESFAGVRLEELASALGGEVTFALDGPMIPTPSWKMILEVRDPARVQDAIRKLVEAANVKLKSEGVAAIEIAETNVTNRERRDVGPVQTTESKLYTVRLPGGGPIAEMHYSFVDGYAVFAASDAVLQRALDDRRAGVTLARSRDFRNLLPGNSRSNVSGLVYQNAGDLLRLMSKGVGQAAGTPEQQKKAEELVSKIEPMVVAIYGGEDRIEVSSQGSALNLLTQSLFMGAANNSGNHRTQKQLRAY